jgi:hypothetical protein
VAYVRNHLFSYKLAPTLSSFACHQTKLLQPQQEDTINRIIKIGIVMRIATYFIQKGCNVIVIQEIF